MSSVILDYINRNLVVLFICQMIFVGGSVLIATVGGVVGHALATRPSLATLPVAVMVIGTASEVIRAHVIAMYLPSLMMPLLISRLGLPRMMVLGVLAMSVTMGIGLAGHHLMHYWFALVLLGIGWNFLFVAGTSQRVQTYRPSERFRAQALNDFSVYSISAGASLMAGAVLFKFGWITVLLSSLPALMLMLVTLAWQQRRLSSAEISR